MIQQNVTKFATFRNNYWPIGFVFDKKRYLQRNVDSGDRNTAAPRLLLDLAEEAQMRVSDCRGSGHSQQQLQRQQLQDLGFGRVLEVAGAAGRSWTWRPSQLRTNLAIRPYVADSAVGPVREMASGRSNSRKTKSHL